jgi:hypothetical protein
VAGPAAAADEGSQIPGNSLWFSTVGPLASQSAATQVLSGSNAVNRPFVGQTTDVACPAGTLQMDSAVRVPQAGVPEDQWIQIPVTSSTVLQDADGRFYTDNNLNGQVDRLDKVDILAYQVAHPGANQYPYITVCRDADAISLGYFRNLLTITGTTSATLAWSIDSPALAKTATSTALVAAPTAVEVGSPVTLTATVTPAAATGSVEFFNGATSLGSSVLSGGVATLTTSVLPVGTDAITAVYGETSGFATSTSSPASVVVSPVAARSTTTTLAVDKLDGAPYQQVTFTTAVAASTGAANGSVTLKDGALVLTTLPVAGGVVAPFTTNVLGAGSHSFVAEFVGAAPYGSSASDPVAAAYASQGVSDEQTVDVTIPVGAISITTPYTPEAPLHLGTAVLDAADSTYSASAAFENIVITDTRAGNLGFTASVVSGAFTNAASETFGGVYAGLTDLTATQVAGNALLATDVVRTNHVPFVDGLDVPKVFATYPAGKPVGTAHLQGTFGIDQVPTSVKPGLYTATVTFTAV